MSSPYKHALSSQQKWGGKWEDYINIHTFLDSSKYHFCNWRHRSVLHHSFGVEICERIFGVIIKNSDEKDVEVKYIAERHIKEDCGYVPTVKEWIFDLPPKKFAINLKPETNEHNTEQSTS
jgi:hypothetical protein